MRPQHALAVSQTFSKEGKCGESLKTPSTEKHYMKCVCVQSLGARQLYLLYSRFLNQPHSGSAAPRLHLHASRSISWRSCRETPAETAIQTRERHRQRTCVCAPPACVSWRQIARDHAELYLLYSRLLNQPHSGSAAPPACIGPTCSSTTRTPAYLPL